MSFHLKFLAILKLNILPSIGMSLSGLSHHSGNVAYENEAVVTFCHVVREELKAACGPLPPRNSSKVDQQDSRSFNPMYIFLGFVF